MLKAPLYSAFLLLNKNVSILFSAAEQMIICFECKSEDETKTQESRIADHLNSRPRLQMNLRSISRIVDYTFTLLFRVYFGSQLDYRLLKLASSSKNKIYRR